uniref:PGG domain-containing protein n=1 Tax=Leersia perrieri TaxID=77586 RepID=A0A0D9XC02_9ORYZ
MEPPPPPSVTMNLLLLAAASFGSSQALCFLFDREDAQERPIVMPTRSFLELLLRDHVSTSLVNTHQQRDNCEVEGGIDQPSFRPAALPLLQGITVVGDTTLHVVASHGDSDNFLNCASIIYNRDNSLLFGTNKKGDTPLHSLVENGVPIPVWKPLLSRFSNRDYAPGIEGRLSIPIFAPLSSSDCAARAGKCRMVSHLIDQARREDDEKVGHSRLDKFLTKENEQKETALHDAVRIGNNDVVEMLMTADPKLAYLPGEGTSPMYLAILLEKDIIADTLYDKSGGNLSYAGPDGQNALHAAVHRGIENKNVNCNLPNNNAESPWDISERKIPAGFFFDWNPGSMIFQALLYCDARKGIGCLDHFQEQYITRPSPENEAKESEKLTTSTQILGIGSVLIATVTFGVTFAVPGSYRSDDHYNAGTPTLAGRHIFDAFIMANTVAFICSSLATVNLMYSGMAMVDLSLRRRHFNITLYFAHSSVTSLGAAFALGAYVVLAHVAHKTAIAICAMMLVASLWEYTELLNGIAVARALLLRMGNWTFLLFAYSIILTTLLIYWPCVIIFGWAGISRP